MRLMILLRIERYLRSTRTAPTRFGRDALGDPCLVFDLRDGRELRRRTAERLSAYLDSVEQERRA